MLNSEPTTRAYTVKSGLEGVDVFSVLPEAAMQPKTRGHITEAY